MQTGRAVTYALLVGVGCEMAAESTSVHLDICVLGRARQRKRVSASNSSDLLGKFATSHCDANMVLRPSPPRLSGSVPSLTEKRPKWPQVAVRRRTTQLVARVLYLYSSKSGPIGQVDLFFFRSTWEEEHSCQG